MEITIHTGLAGDRNVIHIDWFDENNAHHKNTLEINVEDRDRPRAVVLRVDNVPIYHLARKPDDDMALAESILSPDARLVMNEAKKEELEKLICDASERCLKRWFWERNNK